MAIPFIKHDFIGKSKQAKPYTAAAHLRYISRKSATVYRYAERMPLNYHAAQRFLVEREDSIRKNGRVIDKLVISIPREMTMDQAVDTVRNFGFHLSQGRAPFYFTIQNWGESNPHVHFVLVDSDSETGERVFRTTDRDSTDRIKDLWESVCNAHLEQLGIDARISFSEAAELKAAKLEAERYEAEQGVAGKAPIHAEELAEVSQSEVAGNQPADAADDLPLNAPSNESEEVEEQPIPAEDETDAEDAHEGDRDMPLNRKLMLARRQAMELRIMRGRRKEVARLRAEYAHWSAEAVVARQKAELANNAFVDARTRTLTAEQAMKETHFMGFRRGINWKLGPFQIKTAGFDRAVQAEAEQAKAAYAEALRSADLREAHAYADRATRKVEELEQRVASFEQLITMHERINGEENDFDQAEVYFRDSIDHLLKGVSPNDVLDAYEREELSLEEAKALLEEMGHAGLVHWLDVQQEDQGVKH